ncbi:hypothetical protein ACFXGD_10745 [Streptomyces albidoflavus]
MAEVVLASPSRSSAPPGRRACRCRSTVGGVAVPGEERIGLHRLVAESADAELFLFLGDQHLFADSSLPAHDPEAAALLNRRALDFLAAHGESGLRSR